MVQTDKKGNKITLQEDSNYVAITPTNGSTNFVTIAKIIEHLAKEEPEIVIVPENPLEAYYHGECCPHCKKEFKCSILGYSYVQAVGEPNYCPYCGQRLKRRKSK